MKKLLILGTGIVIGGIVMGALVRPTAAPTRAGQEDSAEAQATPRAGQPGTRTPDGLPNLTGVAERSLQASVNISSTSYVRLDPFQQFFYGGDVMPQQSLGSGVLVSADGKVMTAAFDVTAE